MLKGSAWTGAALFLSGCMGGGLKLAGDRDTPMRRQAYAVADLIEKRRCEEADLCALWVARMVMWRRMRFSDKRLFKPDDCDDPRVYKPFCKGTEEYMQHPKKFPDSLFGKYLVNWEKRGEIEKKMDVRHEEIRAAARTKPHRFRLVREAAK